MINPAFLIDSIDIYEEIQQDTGTEYIETCSLIHENVPASLWCWEGQVEILSCLPEKRIWRDICVEIAPNITLACFNAQYIIEITRGGCNIWKYRVHDVIPDVTISQGLHSYHLIATQIDG